MSDSIAMATKSSLSSYVTECIKPAITYFKQKLKKYDKEFCAGRI